MTLSSHRSSGCGLVDSVVAQHRPQDVEASAARAMMDWVWVLPSAR